MSGQARIRMFHLRLNRNASVSAQRSSMTDPLIAIIGKVHVTEHKLNLDSSIDGRIQFFGVAMATSSSSFEIIQRRTGSVMADRVDGVEGWLLRLNSTPAWLRPCQPRRTAQAILVN